jgi:hypothetical protein
MTWLALLYALLFQMNGSELRGDAWFDRFLDLTLQNVKAIQHFFGWVAIAAAVLVVIFLVISVLKGNGFSLASAGCFGSLAVGCIAIWAVGWIHIWIVGYLANNFSAAGGADPGFWVLLILMALIGWS